MRKIISLFVFLAMLLAFLPVQQAQAVAPQNFYLVPVEQVGSARGPEYFRWRFDPDPDSITARWGAADYGFLPSMLLLAFDMSQADHDALCANVDVYCFPDNIDAAITDPNIDTFFEGLNIPTNWLTPSTTYRELLRSSMGMFQYNQRFSAQCGHTLLGEGGYTLDQRWNELTAQDQACFDAVSASFGLPSVTGNPQLRSLVKRVDAYWQSQTFFLGGFGF